MPDESEQNKEHSRISVRIGEFQVELEGAHGNVKKLIGKELVDFIKGLQETPKQVPSSNEITPEVTPKVTPKEETVSPLGRPSTTPEALPQLSRARATEKPAEKAAEKTSRKRVLGRTAVIALGLVCIVLVAGLVGAIAVYTPRVNNLESQIAEKDNTISSLNSTVSSLNNTISSLNRTNQVLQNTISQLSLNQSDISALELQIAYLSNITQLRVHGLLVYNQAVNQAADANTTIFTNVINYAGYVSVDVQSNSTTTYVELAYSSHGVNYDNSVTVGTSGTAAFPVLPGSVEIRVGNTETVDSVNATVTATYYY